MSTDHTSESSWEAAVNPAGHQSYVMPTFDDDGVPADRVQDPDQDSSPELDLELDLESDQDLGPPDDVADQASEEQESASQSLRDSLQRNDVDAIEFRVNRPGTPARRLRLTGNRYTFGSAEGCSIRLNDHGLRPMHAVLIRDASRILIRAYSVPIDVNGTRITEAELHAGDVVRLGAYRFELLNAEESSDRHSQSASEASRPWRSILDPPGSHRCGEASADRPRPELGSGLCSPEDVIWKERLRREIEQWRERQLECDRRENSCDEREAKLRDRETELWSRAENLYRRESRLQSQESATCELYDEFTRHQQELTEVRAAAQKRQESFHQREMVFRNQELEYCQRLDEATRQLHLSQEQAETATQAVQRMREQFDSLNQQIEELSNQHTQIEVREQQQRQDHERLLRELQESRDLAIEGQAESEAQRRAAEDRLEQLEAHLALIQDDRGSDLSVQQERLAASERTAKELRQQVQELQQSLSKAVEESARLRSDYEEAFASVVELESIVAQTSQSSDKDRESWEADADELRASVERLSMELNKANRELDELRDANSQLTARLDDMQRQRDEASAAADARPTPEAFHSLQEELSVTHEQLSQTRHDYQDSLQQLNDVQRERAKEQEQAAQALALAEASRTARSTDSKTEPSDVASVRKVIDSADQFDPEPDFSEEERLAQLSDDSHEFLIEEDEAHGSAREQESPWNLESPATQEIANESESDWGLAESRPAHLRRDVDSDDSDPADGLRGSLANLLIRDLDEESKNHRRDTEAGSLDEDSEADLEASVVPHRGWDHEHNEEAYPTRWKNDPDGFRSEEIEPRDLFDDDAIETTDNPLTEELVDASSEQESLAIMDSTTSLTNDPSADDANDDAEDSIEAYMNRLLRRVQGQPLEDTPQPTPASAAKVLPDKKAAESKARKKDVERLDPNAPLVPRSQAPEKTTSLSAMRELANTSARIAITRSMRVQTRDTQIKGMISLACASGAIICGIACYFYIPGIMRYLAVAMTVVVASIYFREGWLLFRDASRRLKAATLGLAESAAESEKDEN